MRKDDPVNVPFAIAISVAIGLAFVGVSLVCEEEKSRNPPRLVDPALVGPRVVVNLTGPEISWDGASPTRRLGYRSDGVVVWQRIDAEAKP